MLNSREKLLIDDIGRVMNGFRDIETLSLEENPNLDKYEGDWQELCLYIHQLQNWVLSNSAARCHPTEFRPFGCKFKKKVINE